ncbi:hypothetical protein G7L40_00410 [Paenibacillus polymyxa]|uniref:Uncharacterized protein n=1 Tax=Paenibacillus polymyxa TaxID=1406 RepID=A0A378XWZ6_PAEPO|nr:hypothetical protein [Paenibacillus polymyxa]MBE7897172.1 hypothetical protein [Paenibacillus polymyxa]MBG9763029.1 hypothetical protein [Paenibacillus polymyxa]MCC3257579.1 hypothetical protein [Paenibacillus polymyxa]QPK51338.1 hypothetical protein G7035_00410 [Paenibacillus polymyxa]QPK56428.1 hypothetical protein G7L40_00410 [Paenibacillus polymyxa]
MSTITQEQWDQAIEHAEYYRELYKEIPTGIFGLHFLNIMIQRYESGERTVELYEDMMDVE